MKTAFSTLKIAVLAPIPRARIRIERAVMPGDLNRVRKAYRVSWERVSISPRKLLRLSAVRA